MTGAASSLAAPPRTVPLRDPGVAPPGTPHAAETELFLRNARWMNQGQVHPREDAWTRNLLVGAQHPWAMIVSCIDSRVPPELIFDQGLGDLFVARTAGQVLDGAVLGSIIYAALEPTVKLIVVLGHQNCGAVKEAIRKKDNTDPTLPNPYPPRLTYLTEAIKDAIPSVGTPDRQNVSINENVRRIRTQLLGESEIATRVTAGTLDVIGARYELDTWIAHKIAP
ncbi:carbonic anhydrase [Streptomyces yaizuensis]|uniref:Carbonic anhydrase n=1 Tax=Streptomyces yaizuensis TaxID=2989713 RepID=A0ABQ5P962_9ACTN|nr:carbonic anhydrase [Streptomyces sp. YSPA8]GLF99121.1 carbonic anhydrase [Streptomyces sp. YSPA8]